MCDLPFETDSSVRLDQILVTSTETRGRPAVGNLDAGTMGQVDDARNLSLGPDSQGSTNATWGEPNVGRSGRDDTRASSGTPPKFKYDGGDEQL